MKKRFFCVVIALLILTLSIVSCDKAAYPLKACGCPENVICECDFDETESVFSAPRTSLNKGVLYFADRVYCDCPQRYTFTEPENKYELPDVDDFEKEEMPDKTITVGEKTVTLKYSRTYRPQYMSYYVDDYESGDYGVISVGYLENTDTVYSFFHISDLEIYSANLTPQAEYDYVYLCREFMKQTNEFNGYQKYSCKTTVRTTSSHGVDNDIFDEFVPKLEDTEGVEYFYEFTFVEYLHGMPTNNTVQIKLNDKGSLESFNRFGSGDFSSFKDVELDMPFIESVITASVKNMFGSPENKFIDFSMNNRLFILEGQLCVLSMVQPEFEIINEDEAHCSTDIFTLLLPLT